MSPVSALESVTSRARPSGWDAVRDGFPILARRIGSARLTYLDSAATSLKPTRVLRAMASHYEQHDGSPHSALHRLAGEASHALESARARISRFVGARPDDAVVLTRNTTAALNLIARGIEHRLEAGDEILLTELEHHANLVPWIQLARRRDVRLRHLPLREGELDLDALDELLTSRTRVVSLCHVSNVLGTINPVREIAQRAHGVGALVVVDAAQSVGHMPVDLRTLGADLLAFSGHKLYGPAGIGALVGRIAALESLEPLEGGGQMIDEVHLDRASWAPVPQRFEAGTMDVAAAAALVPALDWLDELGLAEVRAREQRLVEHCWRELSRLGAIRLLGPDDPARRGSLVSFADPLVHPHDLATMLDARGVAVRAGHHCAQPLHRKLGLAASVRASFGIYSVAEDVDRLVEGVAHARRLFS